MQQNAYVFVLSVGMLMVIVGRHIDFSVGSVVGFVGAIVGIVIADFSLPWPAAVLAAFTLGALIMGMDSAWQQVIKGLMLLIAVAVDVVAKRRGATRYRALTAGPISP